MSERREAELRLFRDYHASRDPRARDAVVERFMPLARSLARRYHRGVEPLEDLEQVAYLALVKAVDDFDSTRGLAFSSYAVPCIAGTIKRHFRDHGWSVHIPRDLQALALRVEQIYNELFAVGGLAPTDEEMARHAGVSVKDVRDAREAFRALHSDSLDEPQRTRDGVEPASLLETIGAPDPGIDRMIDRTALTSVLGSLDDRSQAIVQLYYRGEQTQAEIGRRLGCSQMHVSRLLRQAVEQLRTTVDDHERQQAARVGASR
jgi:RNA polymerase sigma-B factor